jgi:hypothetical protein
MDKSVFIRNGRFFLLSRDRYELLEKFNERGWFVAYMEPRTAEEFREAVRLSRIWSNIKFGKCVYDDKVTNLVSHYEYMRQQ